jgi:hypothetical protein
MSLPSQVELTGGAFQDAEGNVLANGYLHFLLSVDGSVSGVGNICSGIEIVIQLDSNGNAVAGQFIWGNDVILPPNSFYKVTGFTAEGQPAWGPNNQQVVGSSPFNLGSWIPNQIVSWTPSTSDITLLVDGTLASSQNRQNLYSSDDSVVITDEGGGNVNFQSAGGSAKFPGVWLGNNASGIVGFSLLEGSNIGISFQPFNANSTGANNPTATLQRSIPIVPGSTSTCGGVGDSELDITTGILQDWIMKVGMVGLDVPYRYYVGMADQTLTSIETVFTTDTPAANFIGFRLSSTPDGTTIQAICQTDATHQTVVSTGVVAADHQIFEIIPSNSGATITFKINGTVVATITTNVPTNSTAMAGFMTVDYDGGVATSNATANYYYYYFLLPN